MEYFSAIKRKKVPIPDTNCMYLGNMLSKGTQLQKTHTYYSIYINYPEWADIQRQKIAY